MSPLRPQYGYRPAAESAEPHVTIVTPFYEAWDHFEETAQSVLGQSFQQWEWLIVDDGSKDPRSLEMLARYEALDSRIRVIRQENAGPSAARNRAYAEARCEFIAQIDADDLLEPTAIEKWLWFLESYPEYSFVKGYAVGFQAEEYLWTRGFHTPADFLVENPAQPNSIIRRSVHQAVGGFDEDNRQGFEDWDFWLKCANAGYWGSVIPEYLDWYRRRESHNDKWSNWDGAKQQKTFVSGLKERYPRLWKDGMPSIISPGQLPFDSVADRMPCTNILAKGGRRLLMVLPWMTMGGSDRFTLDALRELHARGWQVSIVTTLHGQNLWQHEFASYSSDIFILENFLRVTDYPRFIRYLIDSRQIDTVLISHSLLGYLLLPYLRSRCPQASYIDYCHIEEREWLNGGYPRFGSALQEALDLNIASSEHLKSWMIERGANRERTEVCYTAIDTELWKPDAQARQRLREQHKIGTDTPVLIYPARLCDQKQPKVFAESLLPLAAEKLDFVAMVVGEGPDMGWLRGFVAKHKLEDRVRFLGRASADDMHALMAASDILFLPSKWEGISLSLYEAMASGLAVVTAVVGGHRELVNADCGYLVEVGDPEEQVGEYARILAQLISDPVLRAGMGERARERVQEEFGIAQMGDRLEALILRARELHAESPRPEISPGLGLEYATMGVEYVRLNDLATHLWQSREHRLGISKSWRDRLLDLAYRGALRLPPKPREMLARVYRRWFVRS